MTWEKRGEWLVASDGWGEVGVMYSRAAKRWHAARLPFLGMPQILGDFASKREAIAAAEAANERVKR